MITNVVTQLRTTNLEVSIRFYTETMGFALEFRFQDFYAGIRAGLEVFHLKLVDDPDPSIEFVRNGEHFHLYFESDDVVAEANRPEEERRTVTARCACNGVGEQTDHPGRR